MGSGGQAPGAADPAQDDLGRGVARLLADVEAWLRAPPPSRSAPLALFDADGTLWAGDLGETAFRRGFVRGVISAPCVEGPLRSWAASWGVHLEGPAERAFAELAARCEGDQILAAAPPALGPDGARVDLYSMQAWAYAGASDEALRAYGASLFAEHFAARVHAFVPGLLDALRQRGIETWVISGTHRALIAPAARTLGFADHQIFGSLPERDAAGRYVPTPGCALYGPAKARLLEGKRVCLAFGDSVQATDREMLALADIPVAVCPAGAHLEAALAQGMRILYEAG